MGWSRRVYNQVPKIRHHSPHCWVKIDTHVYSYFVYFCWWEWRKNIGTFQFSRYVQVYICYKGRIQTFQLGTFFTLKGWGERWPKDPSKFGEKTKCFWSPTTHPLQNWASKKGQMVSNKTVACLSNIIEHYLCRNCHPVLFWRISVQKFKYIVHSFLTEMKY